MSIAIAILIAFLTHEGGHFLAALYFGHVLRFRFSWGRVCVPRYVWEMPATTRRKQRIIALAGFGLEIVVAAALSLIFWTPVFASVSMLHLLLYRFYAGECSDFNWL